ncbi:MAG: hypothetical protein JW697_01995, partial [Kosmotogaceae bacterium]|nr:hypothetical protein [Kosmotogaceae bacterium]
LWCIVVSVSWFVFCSFKRNMSPIFRDRLSRFHTLDEYEGRTGEPLSLHKYLYAHANPVTGSDPSGRCCSLVEVSYVGALIVVGGYLAYSATPDGRRANSALGQLILMQCVNGIDAVYDLFLPMSRIEDNEFSRLAKEEAKVRKMDPCEALKIIRKSIEKDLREKYH